MSDEDRRRERVTFGHGARHLRDPRLFQVEIERAITDDLAGNMPAIRALICRTIEVEGAMIEYRAYRIDQTRVHVGTYYPI